MAAPGYRFADGFELSGDATSPLLRGPRLSVRTLRNASHKHSELQDGTGAAQNAQVWRIIELPSLPDSVSHSGVLTQIGMGKLGRLGLKPAVRFERQVPGEMIHPDVKKLGRINLLGSYA
jgi:hypothetical protein